MFKKQSRGRSLHAMLLRVTHLTFALAGESDAAAVAALRAATAVALTARFGRGHWSGEATEHGVVAGMRRSKVWMARLDDAIVATFRMSTTKPWAIDRTMFAPSGNPLYLTDMAVLPELQRTGIGGRCLAMALQYAAEWPADAIRLDAYDASAGAGAFYERCGFREVGRATFHGVPLVYYERVI